MSQKVLLQSQIENGCYYEGVDVKWAVDKEALLHKVNGLDELGAHAIIIRAFQWWENQNRAFLDELK